MALTDEEKRHIETIEAYRHETRLRLETENSKPARANWRGSLWKFFNSSLFITVVVGSGLGFWLKELDLRRSDEAAKLETRLKLLEEDRGFLVEMIGKVNQDIPKKERMSKALRAYKELMITEYKRELNSDVSFPGIDTILDLSADEVERSESLGETQAVAAPVKAAIVRLEDARTSAESKTAIKPIEDLLRNEKAMANLPDIQQQQLRTIVHQVQTDQSPDFDSSRGKQLGSRIAQIALPETRKEESAAAGILSAAGRGEVSLFIHVANDAQAQQAAKWLERFEEQSPEDFSFTKILRYDQINLAPREKDTDVRYESDDDKELAESIRVALLAALNEKPVDPVELIAPRFRSGSGRQIEVWLNKDVSLKQ
jgi:hypothetical protein